MNPIRRSPLHGSVFALAASTAALLITFLVRPVLEPNIFVLFVAAAWVSAWYHGRTGGLTATGLSALAILYFFLRPDPSETTPAWNILARLVAFIAMGVFVTWVTASWHD